MPAALSVRFDKGDLLLLPANKQGFKGTPTKCSLLFPLPESSG